MGYVLAALSLGFLGSFHCVGMCGPIALALPIGNKGKWGRAVNSLIYNTGRALTYAVFGLLFGLLGKSFVIAGYQQALSITLGAIILILVLTPAKYTQRISAVSFVAPLVSKLKSSLSALFKRKNYGSVFAIGMLNGLLPCGLVYMGIAGAIATGDALNGALFMLFFGLGTWPAMLLVTFGGQFISSAVRTRIRSAVPVFVAIAASLLILRGLGLNIPYVSPTFSHTDCTQHSCCHKH